MQEQKEPPSRLSLQKHLIIICFSLLFALFSLLLRQEGASHYHVGDVAGRNVKATRDIYGEGKEPLIRKGEIIVRAGERIKEEQLKKILAIEGTERASWPLKKTAFLFLLFSLLGCLLYEYAERNIRKFAPSRKDLIFSTLLCLFTFLLFSLSSIFFESFTGEAASEYEYLVPVLLLGMLTRIVLYSEASIILVLLFSLFSSLVFERLDLFVYFLSGGLSASYFSGRCERRSSLLRAGILSSLFTALVIVLLSLLSQDPTSMILRKTGFIFLNGLLSSSIVLGLLPVIEQVFDYVTDIRLIELSDLEHPLLEELMVRAPGTYHHSIVVGTLAKAAAESIGAHPLLARVASYFHDIGKLKMPQYFVENRKENSDPHQDLSPHMSALLILSHVKEGVELAKEGRLGRRIADIIAQHHGTCLLTYFYEKAKQREDPGLAVVEERDFRYPGPRPQTKEAGIVMLADQVEASSRILEDPTPKRIESHVRQIIESVFLDGQLDQCELTLKDLHAIEKSFVNILVGIFHQRIEYPKRAIHGSTDKRRPKGEEVRKAKDKKAFRGVDGVLGA